MPCLTSYDGLLNVKNYSEITPHITLVKSHMKINAWRALSSDLWKVEFEEFQQQQSNNNKKAYMNEHRKIRTEV